MNVENSERKYDIYAILGHAASSLLASGKPVDEDNILTQLSLGREKSVDGMRMLYDEAIRMMSNKTE
ncbi:hypothetical protein [Kosakonia sp. CFBP8986]|jgi:hypothetical protein|uniref:hypothetical protein n=1 Tax=Kosakonia sp. CFBP8986 TaxID=3096524 RepID=UPI002A69B535|nr:hypothetical protein [Kosakonia sp. CFBP8986]MDY0890308.1 hypothetical protein [Kosakonia sp. CFBP8986]